MYTHLSGLNPIPPSSLNSPVRSSSHPDLPSFDNLQWASGGHSPPPPPPELGRRLEKVTRWRKWVKDNAEDAEGKKELAKEVARCLAEEVYPKEIQGVKEEGDVN